MNRLCGSGLDAVMYAARSIAVGEGDIYIAGGTESMTRAPYVMAKPESEFPRGVNGAFRIQRSDGVSRMRNLKRCMARTPCLKRPKNVAQRFSVSRGDQDQFAFQSQQRAKKSSGKWAFH
ncbi:hypothetical protein RCO48_36390 [Peribacillus frigoritolerans]|nr:hypothetical protein [Peribacillus frigoritolerans]